MARGLRWTACGNCVWQDPVETLHGGGFLTTLAMIDLDGEKIRVIPKDYQLDPVRDFPMHVDFLRVAKGAKLTLEIPMQFINEEESPGLTRGGVLNVVRHSVEVEVLGRAGRGDLQLKNLSRNGVLFRSPEVLEVGEQIEIRVIESTVPAITRPLRVSCATSTLLISFCSIYGPFFNDRGMNTLY